MLRADAADRQFVKRITAGGRQDGLLCPRQRLTGGYAMTDVACFCGTSYSFDGDLGVCPKCGEGVNMVSAFPAAERGMQDELEAMREKSALRSVPPATGLADLLARASRG